MTLKQTIEDQARILAVEAHGTHDEDWPDRDRTYCDFVCGADFTARLLLELWRVSVESEDDGAVARAVAALNAYADETLGKSR